MHLIFPHNTINNISIFTEMVKMFATVVLIFVVCWAPYHIYFILSYHHPQITKGTSSNSSCHTKTGLALSPKIL